MQAATPGYVAHRIPVERLEHQRHIVMWVVGLVNESQRLTRPTVGERLLVVRDTGNPVIKQTIVHSDSPKRRIPNFLII